MTRSISIALLITLCAGRAPAAAGPPAPLAVPSVLLARTLPNQPGARDIGSNVLPIDGGALLTGWTHRELHHPADGLLLSVDDDGDVRWRRQLGGAGMDLLWSVLPDPAGGYVVVGFTSSSGAGSFDGWILHVDESGNVDWERTYGGPGEDRLTAIQPTAEGWIAVGQSAGRNDRGVDAWVLRIDRQGNELSSWISGGPDTDRAFNIQPLATGGCIIAGMVGVDPRADYFVARLDANGERLWTVQPERPGFQVAHDVQPHPDGSFLIIGYGFVDEGSHIDGFALRLSPDGTVLSENAFGGATYDRATHGKILGDGSLAVVGYSQRPGAVDDEHGWDMVFYRLAANGEPVSALRFGGDGYELARSIAGDPGNLWLIGHSSSGRQGSGILLVRLDLSGLP